MRTLRHGLAIFLAAVVLRAAGTARTSLGPGEVRGDATFYYQSAVHLAADHSFHDDAGYRALRMPLYPAFLAAVFLAVGPAIMAAQLAQILVGAATCVLIFWGGLAWLPAEGALLAGWASVFYYGLFYPCGRLLTEVFFAFMLAALFALWLRWRCQRRWVLGIAGAGAALYLVRPEGALAALAIALLGPRTRPGWRPLHSLIVAGALALTMLGWGLRNRAALGAFVPGTTGAGFSLWAALPRTMHEHLKLDLGARPAQSPSDELARERFYRAYALQAIRSAPRAKLCEAMLFNLVSQFYPFLPGYELTFMLWLPLWVFAFWSARRERVLWPLLLLTVSWPAVFIVFGGADSRFRQLYAPLLLWLAGAGFTGLRERYGKQKVWRFLLLWGLLNLVPFFFWPQTRALVLKLKLLL
ncbi:MAG: hypothetical protein NTY77_00975 [Elusimicrobia bacterium]|nr:hypothetical protein [Elusimicrobiota bacterium]